MLHKYSYCFITTLYLKTKNSSHIIIIFIFYIFKGIKSNKYKRLPHFDKFSQKYRFDTSKLPM